MAIFLSFSLSIVASVIAYYICKWLDGDEQSVISLGVVHPDEQEPPERGNSLGVRFCVDYGHLYPLCL